MKKLYPDFKKTITGITIAKTLGIPQMRKHCPLFDKWAGKIETLCESIVKNGLRPAINKKSPSGANFLIPSCISTLVVHLNGL
ncbi:MAG: DUF4276 family protein [Chitinispirillales bacterium]|nr:DUF4276 family protein [Chitinispirillales bacterium]